MSYKAGDVINFEYTGSVQTVTLPKGKYKLECWGAQGGYRSSSIYGGAGGYSVGTLALTEKTTLYVYAGGAGNTASLATNNIYPGGFNGGGYRYKYKGGGGASDIRIATDSLYARVIVAGGGGSDGATSKPGKYGGGSTGGTATETYGSYGYGGTQTGHTTSVSMPSSQYRKFTNDTDKYQGGFGFGGFGCTVSSGYGGAGGGGWYGGCGSVPDSSGDDDRGGGGGSGYVYTSSTASNYPSGCLLNSSYYLTNASTIGGNASFTAPNGASENGHSGNGYCRITVIEAASGSLYCKVGSEIKSVESIWFKLNNKIYELASGSINDIINFKYTGSVQTVTLPKGKYKLECWGAQGGTYNTYTGGAGGYSVGVLTLSSETLLYVYVGGQPAPQASSVGATTGGFNGGGNGCYRSYSGTSSYGQGGGGATDIRIATDSLYSRVIVAGGGGGSSSDTSITTKYGGGTSGGSSVSGYGATQTSAGTNGRFGVGGAATTNGTNYKYGSGGGGGGWYGGGACPSYSDSTNYRSYNGGGSGYVYTSSTASNYPSGCQLNPPYYLTDAQTIAGNVAFVSPSGSPETGHTGNGYCRITKLDSKRYGLFIKQNGIWNYIND